jgi:4-amino-4-deoxy-L-arabinose transferase-like glycosyltransferase
MEARNFITAREMIQDNHWLLTTMNGEARYEKPPLPTWLTAISGLAFGINNLFALRLPAAFMVLFLGIFSYYFSLKLNLSKHHSFRNSLILVTSFYVVGILNEAPWDIFAHGFMLAGIYFLFNLFSEKEVRWKNIILAGIFTGFSFLSKGPVSLFALFLPFLISYAIVFKFKEFKQKLLPFLSFILLFLVIGGWWFVYVRYTDPESFLAIATKETGNWSSYNVKPFYYYWSFFIQSGLWTIPSFIGLLYPYLIKKVENKKVYRFTFLWTIFAVILLSIIPEKKARYLMPVLIPLALNTGFYIEYLVKSFSKIIAKKETIPVYFNFGLIATIGFVFPIVLFVILKENLQLYLFNYISTSLILLIISSAIFKFLVQKKFKNVFYLTIFFMVSILVFGLPISKSFNKNEQYNSLKKLHIIEEENNIKTYSIGNITPEMLWDYNGKIKDILINEVLTFPSENTFGLLIPLENNHSIFEQLNSSYDLKLVETFDINVGSKQKDRLSRKFYLVSKK